jgi:hypothetical protein
MIQYSQSPAQGLRERGLLMLSRNFLGSERLLYDTLSLGDSSSRNGPTKWA